MIDDVEARSIEICGKYFFSQRHAYRIGEALSEGTRRGLHSWRVTIFRMAGRFGMKLTEALDFFHRQVITGEVQQCIKQHRAMSIRQYEPVAIDPFWIGRIVAQMMNP